MTFAEKVFPQADLACIRAAASRPMASNMIATGTRSRVKPFRSSLTTFSHGFMPDRGMNLHPPLRSSVQAWIARVQCVKVVERRIRIDRERRDPIEQGEIIE